MMRFGWFLAITSLLGLVLWLGCGPAGSATSGGLALVGEPRVVTDPALMRVDGRVTNKATTPYSGVVTVTLFDGGGKIVGVFTGSVANVQPGEEATYTALGLDKPAAWSKVEARISSQIRG